jgi:hypothetical protein
MAIDFPIPVAVDEEFVDATSGKTYRWDGVAWKIKPADAVVGGPPPGTYVLKAGDTMGGVLSLINPDPATPLEATHKRYVDETIAANSLYQGTWSVAANSPDITPSAAILNSYSWIAVTADPAVPETAPAALPGIGGTLVAEGDNVIWNATLAVYQLVRGDQGVAGDFVLKTGDSMSGQLNLALQPTPLSFGGKVWANVYSPGNESYIEFWTNNGGYSDNWSLKTTAANPPGINVNGNTSTASLNVRSGAVSMGEGAGIHWASTSAVATATDFSEGICLYGFGGTSRFGFTITSGTLNYVVENAANKHNFTVGTENKLNIRADGLFQPTVADNKNGYFIGDRYHGMYFHSGNKLVFTEYHDHFNWRRQTTGTTGLGGDQRMTLIGGNLDAAGTVSTRAVIDRSLLEEHPDLAPFAAGEDPADSEIPQRGVNLGKLLMHALAEIKALKAEVAALKGKK